jgi:DNA (cytosine-5)-methyltransferase 1
MTRPLLLDLFCGAGGGAGPADRSSGYAKHFDVVGVDSAPQPHYPFEFHQADALTFPLDGFDAVHASPPCQAFSFATRHRPGASAKHPDLVAPVRDLLARTGLPYVIENVPEAPLRNDLTLCGEMFGLRVHRHRRFEIGGFPVRQIPHRPHRLSGARDNCHVEEGFTRMVVGHFSNLADARDAMGIDWMNRYELAQAIPPAYTEYIGRQLLAALVAGAVA